MPPLTQPPAPPPSPRPDPFSGTAHDLYRSFGANRRAVTRVLMVLGYLLLPVLIVLLLWLIDNIGTFSGPKE